MRDTDYAFCVARLRANETQLLTSDFVNKLAESTDYKDAVRILAEKGWMNSDDDITAAVKAQNTRLWELLNESVPDKKELDSLCTLNDYFNIKVAVKCLFTGENAESYYIQPTSLDLNKLSEAVKSHEFQALHDTMGKCASQAYDIALKTENGQNADIIIDKAALEFLSEYAKKAKNRIISEICSFTADTSNMKIALRCSATKKNTDFAEAAISVCTYLDRDRLVRYCTTSEEELYNYLLSSKYSEGAELYKRSPAAFDKWCDDKIIDIVKGAKYTAFGFGPVCAYYYAKLTEIKTVRIILTGKLSGVSNDIIKERVRALYV